MAEQNRPAAHEAKPEPAKAGKARGGESGNPAVQKLMAEVQTAQMNRDALTPNEDAVKAADAALKQAKKNLSDAGYVYE